MHDPRSFEFLELHTLFRRESAAEPFFIRIKYMLPSSVPIIISVVSSVPVQGPNLASWKAGSYGIVVLKMAVF
jgi:hypothetical protein